MTDNTSLWAHEAVDEFFKTASDLAIFVVANIKNVTIVKDDYDGFSVHNDYMTESVINDILTGMRECGSYVELFIGENEFISAVLSGHIDSINKPKKIVYNLAQTGTGPARKSLIPTFCKLNHLACANSDGHVVALLRHKYHATSILKAHGLPVPQTWFFRRNGQWLENRPPRDTKIIVKATYEAASIGISDDSVRVSGQDLDAFAAARSLALRQPLTVQEFIEGYEVEVPVFTMPDPFSPAGVGMSIEGVTLPPSLIQLGLESGG